MSIIIACPNCGRGRKVFIKKNAYANFVCKCGVVVTANDLHGLKQQLKAMRVLSSSFRVKKKRNKK